MGKNLKTFLAAWLDWVDGGAPDSAPFERRRGLCSSFEEWNAERDFDIYEADQELCDAFTADGLDETYPFGGAEVFYDAVDNREQHLNEASIQWVRAKVAQHEVA